MVIKSVLADKSYVFALDIIAVYKDLVTSKKEFVLSKQLLKSGTSIGANIREALGGQSRADFICKLSIAHKESLETDYWLNLLRDSGILMRDMAEKLLLQNDELTRMLSSSLLTAKSKLTK